MPALLIKLTGRNRLTRPRKKQSKNVEFLRSERKRNIVKARLMSLGINGDPARLQDAFLQAGVFPAFCRRIIALISPSQPRLYPGDQFSGLERLGHIGISTQCKSDHNIRLPVFRRKENDWDIGNASQPMVELITVHHWHHDVDDS